MRTLSANATAALAENLGTEPIYIITIQWRDEAGVYRYADRPIPELGIEWLIQDASELDAVVTSTSESQQVNVTLEDTDGHIKNLMDHHDIHKRPAWVYQWFDGFSQGDSILLFKGEVNSPITWNAADRSVSFDIVTKVEDKELGFSPEEGEFSFIPNELIGEPWPLCFGTCVNTKALKLDQPSVGITADGVALADPALGARIAALRTQITGFRNQQLYYIYMAALAALDDNEPAREHNQAIADASAESWQNRQREVNTLQAKYNAQLATVRSSIQIFNADRFPTGAVTVRIGDLKVYGSKSGNYFNIISITHPKLEQDPNAVLPYCDGWYSYSSTWGSGIYRGPDNGSSAWHWLPWVKGDGDWGYYYVKPGTNMYLETNEPQKYIVSIVPGVVTGVSSKIQREGQPFFAEVSRDKWSYGFQNYGPISAVTLYLSDALSKGLDGGYSDDLYVNFISSVGPNTVDILEWVIDNYTELSYDSTSFDHVRTRLENYPSHFSIQERFNVMDFLHDVAWQARCSLRLVNDVFYLTYLPEVPTSVATITESEIDLGSFELDHTPTENLTTKMVCNWWATGAQDKPNRTILRHNVSKYGVHESTYDFFIYNNIDFVIKSATFWLIRYSNTWKIARFSTPLKLLAVETQDGVTLDFSVPFSFIADGPIVAVVEEASYNSDDRSIQFQCWTGIKAGQMEQYDFAYPADVDSTLTFPTPEEIALGLDGGWGNNKSAEGSLSTEADEDPAHRVYYTISDPSRFSESGRRYNDRGDPTPADANNGNPGTPQTVTAPILSVANPGPSSGDIAAYAVRDSEWAVNPPEESALARIDLHTTQIYDSETGLEATLSTFFNRVGPAFEKSGNHLHGLTNATWSSSSLTTGYPFEFVYNEDFNIYGAGLAYLYDGGDDY